MARDNSNPKDYSAVWFTILLVLVAAYIMLKDLAVFK